MSYVDPAAGLDFLIGARLEEEKRFNWLVGARLAEAQNFTKQVDFQADKNEQGFTDTVEQAIIDQQNPVYQSAKAILMGALDQYGLGSLADTVWNWYTTEGRSLEQIFLDLKNTPEYKQRFPAMETLAQKGHAISEAEYISLEKTYSQIGRQYGLPTGFYDQPDDFASLISGEVSPQEYSARLQNYQALVFDTDSTARGELQRIYGITTGDIAAYFIDPNKSLPFLAQRFGAAQASAQAQRSGFGGLTQAEAEMLANLDPNSAAQGFGQIVSLSEVAGVLPGEADAGIDRSSLLDATFRGDEMARRRIATKAAGRAATSKGGGGFTTTQSGVAGVGSA